MKARAMQKNVHVSARKANLVCNLIRNKPVTEALIILDNAEKKTAAILKKILNAAVANATNNHQMVGERLYVYGVTANQGATIKRSLPRAKGSANMIRKRHSHIEIILSDDPQQRKKDLLNLGTSTKSKAKVDPKIISKKKTELKPITQPKTTVKLHTDETPSEQEKK
ncbi:MAG: 50S ribosomal protein L22 [Mycoplasmataceae bacterium]|jgi:ribosomal protein L22|nr:50S ribosomal protein L22 [Mycoplasmataceae bacterium]